MIRVGFLYSRLRVEEKLLLKELESRPDIEVVRINDGKRYFDISQLPVDVDVVLEHSISHSRGLYISRIFEAHGIPVVNSSAVAEKCGDKYITSQLLEQKGIPTPRVLLAFDADAALAATDAMGYPCVLKPVVGSWGRLLARVDSHDMAEAVIEHKASLGVNHKVFYVQEYIDKPGRDIRVFVIGDEPIGAIYRSSDNWITNTARGGLASHCPLTPELNHICRETARAMGSGLLAVDVFETDDGFTINEVNHTMEFRNSIETTGINIPARMADYIVEQGESAKAQKEMVRRTTDWQSLAARRSTQPTPQILHMQS